VTGVHDRRNGFDGLSGALPPGSVQSFDKYRHMTVPCIAIPSLFAEQNGGHQPKAVTITCHGAYFSNRTGLKRRNGAVWALRLVSSCRRITVRLSAAGSLWRN